MDFKVLDKASESLQERLRLDECNPDLGDQFAYRPDVLGSQRYFVEPYRSLWGSMIEYGDFVPLPKRVLDQYARIQCASFMGLLPEINRAWITVDNQLFLWDYTQPSDDCDVYDGISEVIVSVALSVPKPGVFMDTVKYVLCVSSPVEVVLLAVTCDSLGNSLKLVPTAYTLPSDNVAMIKVVGSQMGRVFMAGNDGNVYELEYSNGDADTVWGALEGAMGGPRHKCRKVNHFAWNWRLVHLLPPFLQALTMEEDGLVDLAVDSVRKVLYAATSHGALSAFYLGPGGTETTLFLASYQVLEAAKAHLQYCRSLPEGSPKPEIFTNAASAGFTVTSLHVLAPTESRKIHLVVVLGNGIRIYLSLITANRTLFTDAPGARTAAGVEVAYVRSPPSPSALKASGSRGADDVENGSVPSFMPSQALRVSTALCAQGVTLLALDKMQHPDELACCFEDLASRSNVTMAPAYQPPSMREGISVAIDETRNGSKIHDVKEHCAQMHSIEAAKLRALYAHSATPAPALIRDASHHLEGAPAPAHKSFTWLEPPPVTPQAAWSGALAMAGKGFGDLGQVALLGEMCWQHAPCSTLSLQRQFLVLTNQGLHTLHKLRPSDILYRQLVQINSHTDECRLFFSLYGPLEASAMCVALACGLPCDAGGAGPGLSLPHRTLLMPLDTLQKRAMSVMLALTQGPSYKGLLTGALQDSRLVLNASHHEFVKSSAHDALYLVASRILRPVWLRAVVAQGKVSKIWTAALIGEIRGPLVQLQKMLRGFFCAAVMDSQQAHITELAADVPRDKMTRHMLDQARSSVNAEKALQLQAKSLENASLNALYRLVSRTIQALSFVQILTDKSVSVKWGQLGSVSFRALVVSSKVFDNVKKVLGALISDVTGKGEQLIDLLSRECCFYFSVGDRCLYEASRVAKRVAQLKSGPAEAAEEVRSLSARCVQLLLGAAHFWRSVESVSGEQSELWKRCTALLDMGVDLCLAAAENFLTLEEGPFKRAPGLQGVEGVEVEGVDWEAQLRMESGSLSDAERAAAVDACHLCLVQHIMTVGQEVRRLGAGIVPLTPEEDVMAVQHMHRMILRAVGRCKDASFYLHLGDRLAKDHAPQLLAVRSPHVETYLRARDPQLLHAYYHRHGNFLEAANLMSLLARDEADVSIEQRIAYLGMAVASAEKAVTGSSDAHLICENLAELRDTLDIAAHQQMAHLQLGAEFSSYNYTTPANRSRFSEAERRPLDLLERVVHQSQYQLMSITQLFHEVCTPYKLWELCLLLLHISKHDDADLMARLWRSLIFRIVPEDAQTEEGRLFLQLKREAGRMDVDKRHQRRDVLFEASEQWQPQLGERVTELAKQLGPLSPAFPSLLVLEELEELAATLFVCTGAGDRGFTARCLREVGFTPSALLEAYMEVFGRWAGKAPEKLLQALSSAVYVLLHWGEDDRQLLQAVRSGRLSGWVEKLRRHVSTLGARKMSPPCAVLLQEVGGELAEVRRRVAELTMA